MTELMAASNQWAFRPKDERFSSLVEMEKVTKAYREAQVENTAHLDIFEPVLSRFTNWSYYQLCNAINAPYKYLLSLPESVQYDCLINGCTRTNREYKFLLQSRENGYAKVNAITGVRYPRTWNHEIIERLRHTLGNNWTTPPAYGEGPHGLYASDRDMFIFMVNEDKRIDDGSQDGLAKGFFIKNSEVGNGALEFWKFYYRYVCSNHIVWGASNVAKFSIIHRGQIEQRLKHMWYKIQKWVDEPETKTKEQIQKAKEYIIAKSVNNLVSRLEACQIGSQKQMRIAYKYAEDLAEDFEPNSLWGMAQGISRYSQEFSAYSGIRSKLDRAAGQMFTLFLGA